MPIPTIVAEVMTSSPRTLTASDTVRTAAREMKRLDLDAVVVEHEGRTLGVVTDRDLVLSCLADGSDPEQTPLGSLCAPQSVSLSPRDAVDNAATLMRDRRVRRVPVVHDGRAVGLISPTNLAQRHDPFAALSKLAPGADTHSDTHLPPHESHRAHAG